MVGKVFRGMWSGTTVIAMKKLHGQDQVKEFEAEAALLKYKYDRYFFLIFSANCDIHV
jgi:hypothetical protein